MPINNVSLGNDNEGAWPAETEREVTIRPLSFSARARRKQKKRGEAAVREIFACLSCLPVVFPVLSFILSFFLSSLLSLHAFPPSFHLPRRRS